MPNRQETLDRIRNHAEISVLIVGAGVNGVGLLRELALQNVDALLIDKGDYCSGTSAASTRAIVGGLRYLENGEFRLVREALAERNGLLHNAPHYIRPLAFTIPIFHYTTGLIHAARKFFGLSSVPGDRGALVIKIGLMLYDAINRSRKTLPNHSFMSRAESLAHYPHLTPDIIMTATFYDAHVSHPERMCFELVEDAETIHPAAQALNYVRLESAAGDTVTLVDEITGETLTVKPKLVVNATGAWIDFTNQALQRETQFIQGTKGSHLVLDHQELAQEIGDRLIYFSNEDGRVTVFYRFFDKIMAGTTDIPVTDPETARCDADEIHYILAAIKQVCPTIEMNEDQIVFAFCGVRPLPKKSATTVGQISRDHSNQIVPAGNGIDFAVHSLVGGKWTTFRAFAEQVTDRILAEFGQARKADSHDMAIGGGKDYPASAADQARWVAQISESTGLPTEHVAALFKRYGTRAERVAEYIAAGEDAPLQHHPAYTRREIAFLTEYEQVLHVDDILLRRTLMGMLGEFNQALLQEIAAVMAPILGWSTEQAQQEVNRTIDILVDRHNVRREDLATRVFNHNSDVAVATAEHA